MQQRTRTPHASAALRKVGRPVFQFRYTAQPSNSGSSDRTAAFAIRITPQRSPYAPQSRARAEPATLSVAHTAVAPSSAESEVSQRLWKLSRIALGNTAHSHAAPPPIYEPRPRPPTRLPA